MDTQESYPPQHTHKGSTNILALIRTIALHRDGGTGLGIMYHGGGGGGGGVFI